MNKCAYYVSESSSAAAFDCEGLTFDEEIELSKRILAGEAARHEIAENGAPVKQNLSILNRTVRDGELAFEQLVTANMPRAMKMAMEAWKKNPFGINDIDDYRQTALKVICGCARTYDWRMGCRFGTYVHNSLKNEMIRENARTGYAIKIPEENLCRLNKLRRQKAENQLGDLAENERKSAEKLLAFCSVSKSLEEPAAGEDADVEFGEMIADPAAVSAGMIEDEIFDDFQFSKLRDALAALPEDERSLLKTRMGFDGEPQPLKAFVGIYAKSISGAQKKQIAAEKHLKEIFNSLPEGRLDFLNFLFLQIAGKQIILKL